MHCHWMAEAGTVEFFVEVLHAPGPEQTGAEPQGARTIRGFGIQHHMMHGAGRSHHT